MGFSHARLRTVARVAQIGALAAFSLALVLTVAFLICEVRWVSPKQVDDPKLAYTHATIGTELMPLPVAMVLPDLFPEHFQPAGMDKGDWIDQFGFIRRDDPSIKGLSKYFEEPDSDLAGFPVGFCRL